MASDFAKKFEDLSITNAEKLSQEQAIHKVKDKLKLKEAIQRATEPIDASSKNNKPVVLKPRKLTAGEVRTIHKSAQLADAKKNEAKRHAMRSKLESYWNSPIVGQYAPKGHPRSAAGLSDDETAYQLKLMRDNIAIGQSGPMLQLGFVAMMRLIVYAVHDLQINPMDWRLQDLPGALNDTRAREHIMDRFQPELEEARIEMGSLFVQPWYMRLLNKGYVFCQDWSNGIKAREISEQAQSIKVEPGRYGNTEGL